MSRSFIRVVGLLLVAFPTAAIAQNPKPEVGPDARLAATAVSQLFPADTIAYLELIRPAEAAANLHGFFRGSIIEKAVEFLAEQREIRPETGDGSFEQLGLLLGFFGPETFTEIGRMRGVALAVTGFDESKQPIIVGVLLSGESRLPGLLLRISMCFNSSARIAGRVGQIPIYGHVPFDPVPPLPMAGQIAPPPPRPVNEPPFIASAGDLIVIANRRSAVEGVLKRWLGQDATPSLQTELGSSSAGSFQERPGLLGLVRTRSLPDLLAAFTDEDHNDESLAWGKALGELLSPDVVPDVGMHVGIANDACELRLSARTKSDKRHPLLELVTSPPRGDAFKQSVAVNALSGVAFRVQDGAPWFRRMTELSDRVTKAFGVSVAEVIGEIEKKLGRSLADDLWGKIDEVAIAWPASQNLPQGAEEMCMWMVTAKDPVSATEIESLVPMWMSALVNESLEPVKETIGGVKVHSVSSQGFPWRAPLNYGRRDKHLVFGLDRKLVAAVLSGQPIERNPSEALQEALKGKNLVAFWSWGHHLPRFDAAWSLRTTGDDNDPARPVDSEVERKRVAEIEKSWLPVISALPPLVVIAESGESPAAQGLLFRQSLPSTLRTKILDGVFRSLFDSSMGREDTAPIPPPPPPPVKN